MYKYEYVSSLNVYEVVSNRDSSSGLRSYQPIFFSYSSFLLAYNYPYMHRKQVNKYLNRGDHLIQLIVARSSDYQTTVPIH